MKHPFRSPLLVLSVLFTALSPLVAAAPQKAASQKEAPAVQPELPGARAIVDRFVEVTHAKQGLEKTQSMHIKGSFEMEAMGLKGAADIWSAKPDRRQVSIDMGGFGQMMTGFDGKSAWMTHPMMGARVLSGSEFLQNALEADYFAALKSDKHYESMKTLGREAFEGKDCYKIELVARPLAGMDAPSTLAARTSQEFYEVSSGLLVGTSGIQEGEMGGGPFTTVISDYKDFGGQLFATRTRVRQSQVEILLTVDSVEYDKATAETFVLPVEIQRLVEVEASK